MKLALGNRARRTRLPDDALLPDAPTGAGRGLLVFFLLLAVVLSTANAHRQPIRFDALSLEDGLSQATVNSIHQDSRGFLWLGTEDGLNRFDGYEFVVYKHRTGDETSLPADAVWTIEEDSTGRLWIATDGGGVARWDPANDHFERLDALGASGGQAPVFARSLLLDDDGSLWVASREAGLWHFASDGEPLANYRHDPDVPTSIGGDAVFALALAADGALWVGTETGLDRLDRATGQFTHWRATEGPAGLSDNRVRSLLLDTGGTLWIGTYGGGVTRLGADGAVSQLRADPEQPDALPQDRVRAIFEDAQGRIWIGTAGGLCLFDPERDACDVYTAEEGIPGDLGDSDVMSFAQDRGGVLWFGTRSGGIHRWHPDSWKFGHSAPGDDGLGHGTVTGFSEDPAGRVWIATLGGGLHRLDPATATIARWAADGTEAPFVSNFIASLLANDDGTVWVGTFDAGLLLVSPDGTVLQSYAPIPDDPTALAAEGVTSLLRDQRQTLWAGTFGGGLHRFVPGTGSFERFGEAQGLSSARVISLAEDARGRIWVGTDAGGLNMLDPVTGEIRQFPATPGDPTALPSDTIFSLYGGDPDALWVGTRGAGLVRLDLASIDDGDARYEVYGEERGLANDVVYGIQPDDDGRLWLSTNGGLIRVNPSTGAIANFDVNDGLQSNEFTFGAHYRDRAGRLYFGGVNGYNAFLPAAIEASDYAAPLLLTGVSVLGQPVPGLAPAYTLEELALGYRDDLVTFEVAALDFVDPASNRYTYRLDGLDRRWIELGPHRRISFTDLDGGNYTLRVRGSNHDGVWNDAGEIALRLTVAPPPWKTSWAYAGYAFLIILALATWSMLHRIRLAREEAYRHRLEQTVAERTRDLADRNEDLEVANTRLREASLTDALTGLRNRRFLAEHISEETSLVSRRYEELAEGVERIRVFDLVFLIVDIDHFKQINDTHGHLAGDSVLVQVRDVLQETCRQSDILVRWGGDEFLIVARDAKPNRGREVAERVRGAIATRAFELPDGQTVGTTCSIGFASFPPVRDEPTLLNWNDTLMFADTALYAAKASGRNAWVGLSTTPASGTVDLPKRIRDDAQQAVAEGFIAVISSLEDGTELKWKSS